MILDSLCFAYCIIIYLGLLNYFGSGSSGGEGPKVNLAEHIKNFSTQNKFLASNFLFSLPTQKPKPPTEEGAMGTTRYAFLLPFSFQYIYITLTVIIFRLCAWFLNSLISTFLTYLYAWTYVFCRLMAAYQSQSIQRLQSAQVEKVISLVLRLDFMFI